MTRRVLVTRPEPGASATAARLQTMGYEPVVLPLTEIVALPPPPTPDARLYDAVAVTSVNALRHVPAGFVAALSNKPLFAVGDRTAASALEAGFQNVRSASGTAADLASVIVKAFPQGGRILHLTGADRTTGFDAVLSAFDIETETIELYRATPVSYSTDSLQKTFERGPVWGALVFSPRGGELLANLAMQPLMAEILEKTRFFCISERAAAALKDRSDDRVSVSPQPTEDAVQLLLSSQA